MDNDHMGTKLEFYYRAVNFFESLSNTAPSLDDPKNRKFVIPRMRWLLHALGNPDRGFKYIHITGTAGKGTVATMMHETLSASGKRVGLFTSPFCVTSIERIRVNELFISPKEFSDLTDRIRPAISKACVVSPYGSPHYFEALFALALLYFGEKKCEWVILEVAAGGRTDPTNVILHPRVTVITNIHYDHLNLLGETLPEIAKEKSYVIKRGSHFFTAEQNPRIQRIFQHVSRKQKVTPHLISADLLSQNKALADALGKFLRISKHWRRKGMKKTRLPCRFEVIQRNPRVILDGAHNEIKMRHTVLNLASLSYQKLFLIFALAADKRASQIVKIIAPYADKIFLTRFLMPFRKCANPKRLMALFQKYGKPVVQKNFFSDPNQALEQALSCASSRDLILVTGSFYLAGELRKQWYSEAWILENRKNF